MKLKIRKTIPNIITIGRMIFSLSLLILPISLPFAIVYLLCGFSDMLDGFIARKLHAESQTGAMLDSIADLIFALTYAVKILPCLSIPLWLWIWIVLIAIIKITGIVIVGKKAHKLFIAHSFGNKLTGLMLFVLPLTLYVTDVKVAVILACTVATVTAIAETINGFKKPIILPLDIRRIK